MKKSLSYWTATLMIVFLASGLIVACEKKGPMEKMGERLDETIEDAKDGLEDLGDELEDLGDDLEDLGDELEEGAEELGNKIEDAAEEAKEKLDSDG